MWPSDACLEPTRTPANAGAVQGEVDRDFIWIVRPDDSLDKPSRARSGVATAVSMSSCDRGSNRYAFGDALGKHEFECYPDANFSS